MLWLSKFFKTSKNLNFTINLFNSYWIFNFFLFSIYEGKLENMFPLLLFMRNYKAMGQVKHWFTTRVIHTLFSDYDQDPVDDTGAVLAESSNEWIALWSANIESRLLLKTWTKEEVNIVDQYEWACLSKGAEIQKKLMEMYGPGVIATLILECPTVLTWHQSTSTFFWH